MIKEEKKRPTIRFKGFEDDWEQRKIFELTDRIDTGKSEFSNESIGKYAILGSTSVIGYDRTFDYKGDFLLTARVGANAGNLYRYTGKVKISDNTVFLQGKQVDFLYYLLDHFNIKKLSFGTGQPLIKASELKKLTLWVPQSDKERNRIGIYFKNLDNLITLHQRKLDQVQTLKKYFLQNMFPAKGETVPKIRFKGFTGDWEQRKFSEIAERTSKSGVSSAEFPSVEYEDVIAEEGVLNKNIRLKGTGKRGILFTGTQILFGKLRPYLLNWLNPDFAGVAVGDWWVLQPKNLEKFFLYVLIQTHRFDEIANQSAGSKMPRADWNLVANSEFCVPKIVEEQKNIGRYFQQLDHLITLHHRKIDQLQILKKFMLQNLFV